MNDKRYRDLNERDENRKASASWIGKFFAIFFGVVTPVRCTGKLYLVKKLQEYKVDTSVFSEQCLQELVEAILQQSDYRRNIFVSHTNDVALLIKCRLDGDNLFMAAMGWPKPFVDILCRHNLLQKA